jgi:hypothetical protein
VASGTDLPADINDARQEIRELRQALESRSVIDQAKGLVRAWLCCDEDEAFQALTAASQHANVKLRVLATELVQLASNCDDDTHPWLEHHVGPQREAAPPQAEGF